MRARKTQRERAASLVEFALVIPILTLFLFGIVQFGIAYDKQQSINSAAREGARLGALDTTTLASIAQRSVDAYDASVAPGAQPKVAVFDDQPTPALHGVRCTSGRFRLVDNCAANPASDSVDEDDATRMPCGEDPNDTDGDPATPSEVVRVVVSTPFDITIPFFGVQTVTIDAEAEFRCE